MVILDISYILDGVTAVRFKYLFKTSKIFKDTD